MAQLRAAEESFVIIGLPKAAAIVRHARMALTQRGLPVAVHQVADMIEQSLAEVDELVDQMIAEFANAQARDRHGTPS